MTTNNRFATNPRASKARWVGWGASALALVLSAAAYGQYQDEAGMEVLTRGPMHEAFAEASMMGATAGAVISKAVYAPITETPPDFRPEGDNVAWIPGYWGWDYDRDDFIWVSGVWRDLPPGRQWVPGYWARVEGGSQWISGFWDNVAQTEVVYLPEPPRPLEVGPNSPQPSLNALWSPGCWVWRERSYLWQPGYWVQQQPDWVWTSSHYTWTPRGYVFVGGYWDHDFDHRGVLFAPVYFDRPIYTRPNYRYSPSIVINLAAVFTNLFVQTDSRHYYFGDYYDARYESRGIYPWHSERIRRYGDDAVFHQYRDAQLRRDPQWDNHADEEFRHRREHADARPPQTFGQQRERVESHPDRTPDSDRIGRSLAEVVQSGTRTRQFTPVNENERRDYQTQGRDVHEFQSRRAAVESRQEPGRKPQTGRDRENPVSVQLPPSPLKPRSPATIRKPPPMPVAPSPRTVEGQRQFPNPRDPAARPERGNSQKEPRNSRESGRTTKAPKGPKKPHPSGGKP